MVPLDGETLASATDALVERLTASGVVTAPDKLRQRILEERAEDIVTLSDRGFVLHYRTDAVKEIAAAIGITREPICLFGDGDGGGACARVVLLLVAPPRQAARYLQLLNAFAQLLSREELLAGLLARPDADAIARYGPLVGWELPEQLTVRDLMSEHPRTTTPDTPLKEAARMMLRAGLGALPVVDADRQLVGLLSEKELLRNLLVSLQAQSRPPHPPAGPGARSSRCAT